MRRQGLYLVLTYEEFWKLYFTKPYHFISNFL